MSLHYLKLTAEAEGQMMEGKVQLKHHFMFSELLWNYCWILGDERKRRVRMGVRISKHMDYVHDNTLPSSLKTYNLLWRFKSLQSCKQIDWGQSIPLQKDFSRSSGHVLQFTLDTNILWVLKLARWHWWMKNQSRALIFYNISSKKWKFWLIVGNYKLQLKCSIAKIVVLVTCRLSYILQIQINRPNFWTQVTQVTNIFLTFEIQNGDNMISNFTSTPSYWKCRKPLQGISA